MKQIKAPVSPVVKYKFMFDFSFFLKNQQQQKKLISCLGYFFKLLFYGFINLNVV